MDDQIATLERFVPFQPREEPVACTIAKKLAGLESYVVHLVRPHYEVRFVRYNNRGNFVDAAVARPLSPDLVSPEIYELGTVKGVGEAVPGLQVQKSGRSSGLTRGQVLAVGVTLQVQEGEQKYTFQDQVVSDLVSQPGDSGSLVLDMENRAVGLLFAGSDKYTIFNKIEHVLEQLRITF